MSFLDDLFDLGSNVLGFIGSNDIGGALARTAITGFALNQVTKSINADNAQDTTITQSALPDPGVRIQVEPDTENRIPVVYGQATLGGIITDAQLVNGNQTMFYCITICEHTGFLNFGQGAGSVFTFKNIYWNDNLIEFASDGQTVSRFIDRDGNVDTSPAGLIRFYLYNNNSGSPVLPELYSGGSLYNAKQIMPGWSEAGIDMQDLVFAIVRVDYNKDKGITSLGNIKFTISNSMNNPGDVLYDYMTNTRYGAGIPSTEIYKS